MLKFLLGLSIQQWVIVGLIALLGAAGLTIHFQKVTIGNQREKIIELNVDVKRWKGATDALAESLTEQNIAIQALEYEKKQAEKRATLAAKKAKAIVMNRQAQKNKATARSDGIDTADAAIERAKADLAGSPL